MTKDLTIGEPKKVLWRFCLPLFGSVIFQQLYNIADSFVAGKFINENALAAVGNSYEVTLIFIAIAFGCNIGCSVVVSKLFGEKKYCDMKTAVYTTLITCAALCGVLMLGGFLLTRSLLEMIHTPADIFVDSAKYLDIYILGLPFLFFYNVANGIFSALGDSKTPFFFLASSSVINIMVDILFVAVFQMGVPGVAWATFLCQGVSCLLAVGVVLMRMHKIKTTQRAKRFSGKILRDISQIAIPSILQQSFISIGNIVIQREINDYGAGVIAGYAAAVKLNNMIITSFTTIGNGISNFTAQNLGANKLTRIKEGHKAGIGLVWTICVPVVIVYMLSGKYLLYFFMKDKDGETLKTGLQFLRIVAPFYFVISVKLVSDGVLRGAGKMRQFMIATFTDLILRVVLAIVFSRWIGSVGIWCAWPVGWSIATCISLWFTKVLVKDGEKNSFI